MVGMSGGVDSSVAALLLLEQGHQVEGLFMKNWEEDDDADYCAASKDLEDAERVCQRLGIPLHRANFATEYWDRVFSSFLEEYRVGRTPNPDVLCNREIKFTAFLEHAHSLGADRIATGHYARIERAANGWQLLRGADSEKDQSYFLYLLTQEQLAQSLFPLGGLSKSRVRALASAAGLHNAERKDSTGICFIGERRFRDFLARYLPAQPGDIVTPDGSLVGQHRGVMYYTLGQRQGLGIGGTRNGSDKPWYVVDKDVSSNRLVVAQDHDHPLLMRRALAACRTHWISANPPPAPTACRARIRHRQPLQNCTIATLSGDHCEVRFDVPQRAITPGQSVVFYDGDACLGGGIIEETL
jgi:tRNA-specific 2-thiouridylase